MFTIWQRNYRRVAESEGRELHDCKANSTGGLLRQKSLEERKSGPRQSWLKGS